MAPNRWGVQKRVLQLEAKVRRRVGELFERRSLIGVHTGLQVVAGYVVNRTAVLGRSPQAVRNAIPVPVKVEKFVDEVVDLGGVRVRVRLAEHFLGDRAKQRHVVALDDGCGEPSASPIAPAR